MTSGLRREFEAALISPYGLHLDSARCRVAWEKSPEDDAEIERQIALADAWLQLMGRTKHINRKAGTSYHLKHVVERWHREDVHRTGNCYVSNGCFLMASQRLGFLMKGAQGNYCLAGWDCLNAWINIGLKRLPGAVVGDRDAYELEQALLGVILVNNEAYHRVRGFVTRDSFRSPLHALVFELASEMIEAGRIATPVTVWERFGDDPVVIPSLQRFLARCAADATTVDASFDLALRMATRGSA